MKLKMKVNKILILISILFISLYLPLTFTIYSSTWYEFNYGLDNTYSSLDKNFTLNQTSNLINFFYHKESLNSNWSLKENKHFNDVRNIYDSLFILFLISIIIIIFNLKKINLKKISKYNLIIISSLLLILPFFSYFWTNIFHQIFFNNTFWINTVNDLSYYLFPLEFFIRSSIFIIIIGLIINFLVYFKDKFNYKKI